MGITIVVSAGHSELSHVAGYYGGAQKLYPVSKMEHQCSVWICQNGVYNDQTQGSLIVLSV